MIFDFDGTLADLQDNPDNVEIPKETYETLKNLSQFENINITILTGRDVKTALKLLTVHEDNKNQCIFDIIGSHGTEYIRKNQSEIITIPLTNAEKSVQEKFLNLTKDLKLEYPEMIIEEKCAGVGFNLVAIKTDNLSDFIENHITNPILDIIKDHEFSIHAETAHECDVRHKTWNKASGFEYFMKLNPKNLYTFAGDTIFSGTDQKIAELIKENNGLVYSVDNQRDKRAPDYPYFNRPEEMATALAQLKNKLLETGMTHENTTQNPSRYPT
jgi:trehalose-phosphatase